MPKSREECIWFENYKDMKTAIVMVALIALSPFEELDWTMTNLYDEKSMNLGAERIQAIWEYYRLFARPAVDSSYYLSLSKREQQMELEIFRRTIHNIRNPAASLRTYFKILERKISEQSALDTLKNAEEQLGRIEKISENVIRLLRPLPLRQKVVNIDNLLREITDGFLGAREDILVTYKLNQSDVQVEVDVDSIKEVFEELIRNATKAMEEKPNKTIVLITRSAEEEDLAKFALVANKKYVCIDISDSGSGVPGKIKGKIFDRLEGARYIGGGLYIAKKTIEEQNGSIWLAETSSTGSKFSIALPIYEGEKKGENGQN